MMPHTLFMRTFFITASIYFLMCLITFFISLWGIFKKEKIKSYYALIPFVNIYYYFKICNIPFWTFFIPLVNIITLCCAPYVITKIYMCKKWQSILAIFFPFVFLPFIAFTNKRNVNWFIDEKYVYNLNDIDQLEKSLVSQNGYEIDDDSEKINASKNSKEKMIFDSVISDIENNVQQDEYIYEDDIVKHDIFNDTMQNVDSFKELDDNINIEELNISNIDNLEEKIKIDTSTEKKIEKNIKEYKEFGATNEAIAFGGEKRIENIHAVQTKKDELKCPRCGSSLVGARNFCPGCGTKI